MSETTLAQNLQGRLLSSPAGQQWQRLGVTHRHGVATPLFALRTASSGGIGEYLDLIPLIDWCRSVNFSVLQLLPLNDTGPDPSPYNALSAYALNPLHLSLSQLDGFKGQEQLTPFNASPRIDYPGVGSKKAALLERYVKEHQDTIIRQEEVQQFLRQEWIAPYAVFKTVHAQQGHRPWWEWPEPLRHPSPDLLARYQEAITFHGIIQYLCDQQLRQARAHADEGGVLLLGDIPILLSPNSADVWWHQQYFDLSASVGAPPDQFSETGQNWGFPLYRWDNLRRDDYGWWRKRLQLAAQYFQLYRIDHIVGFFRIWRIPKGKQGNEGEFVPPELNAALTQGREILTMMLQSAPTLPIGEDLGSVPNEVRQTMSSLGICGTRVMRWERRWEGDRSFLPISAYTPESLCCVSTHDTEPLALWWAAHPDESKLYAEQQGWSWEPALSVETRRTILRECHHSASLFHINPLQEYLALFPDLVNADPNLERINDPSGGHNWTYRFKIPIEQLNAHEGLRRAIRELLA